MGQSKAVHSCGFCNSLAIDLEKHYETVEVIAATTELQFDVCLNDVRKGLENRCSLCAWLVAQWASVGPFEWADRSVRANELFLCAQVSQSSGRHFDIDEISWFGLRDKRTGELRIRSQGSLALWAMEDDSASEFVRTRPINFSVGSPENLALARSWLSNCEEDHPFCPDSTDALSVMPTRILEIHKSQDDGQPDDFEVKLRTSVDPKPFLALSYCWGGDQLHKTTSTSSWAQVHDEGVVPWSNLPKTIQDAARVTVGLDFEYLWIDSLCIIQDDPRDVAVEISMMDQVYSSAAITLVASRAKKASDGFLHDLNDTSILECRIPYHCPGGDIGPVITAAFKTSLKAEEPVDLRGWTLQERYLSEKLLEFGSKQLRWTCTCSSSEGGMTDGWRREPELSDTRPELWIQSGPLTPSEVVAKYRAMADWKRLIEAYTCRQLAVSTDRPLAISGMCQKFAGFLGTYCAGHWKEYLPVDLLWTLAYPYKRESRPENFQGPSWSWTGINGPVSFALCMHDQDPPEVLVEIISAETELVEPRARYGAVKSGSICLKGRLRAAQWVRNDNQNVFDRFDKLCEPGRPDKVLDSRMEPDAVENDFQGDMGRKEFDIVWLLEVCSWKGGDTTDLRVGLVLRELPRSSAASKRTFTRLGMFHSNVLKEPDEDQVRSSQDGLSDSDVEEIRLV